MGKPTLYAFPGGSRSIVSDPVQRGRHAAKLALALDDGKQQHVGFLVGGLPPTAYYSAWFLWPRSYSAAYWVIFHLRQATSDDTRPDEPLVALSVQGDGTTMNLALLYTDALLDPVASSPIALPIGRWVHLLMRYENRGNEPGRVTVWQDDVKILSREDVPPATFGRPYWNVGSIAEVIEPAPAEVFLDEVAIAPERTP